MGEKQGVDIQVDIQTGYSFLGKLDIQNSVPDGGGKGVENSQKNGVKYRKLTL